MIRIIISILIVISSINAQYIRDSRLKVVKDTSNNLMWQDDNKAKTIKKNWKDAVDYCQGLELDGYDDWRLPTINELKSIVDYNRYKPAINSKFKNVSIDDWYWSSTSYNKNSAWLVSFDDGNDGHFFSEGVLYIRCIR